MTIAAISFVTYIAAGFIRNWAISLLIGIVITVGCLLIIRGSAKDKAAEKAA